MQTILVSAFSLRTALQTVPCKIGIAIRYNRKTPSRGPKLDVLFPREFSIFSYKPTRVEENSELTSMPRREIK